MQSHLSLPEPFRTPQMVIPIAAITLTTAKNLFASAWNSPPRLKSAPWFTCGGSGPFHLLNGQSQFGGEIGSYWTKKRSTPGITSRCPVYRPSSYSQLNMPYLLAWSAAKPNVASENRSQRYERFGMSNSQRRNYLTIDPQCKGVNS